MASKPTFTETLLYKGKLRIRFNPDAVYERYQVFLKGKEISPDSVTEIIKIKDKSKPLGIWQAREIKKFLMKILPQTITAEDILAAVGQGRKKKTEAAAIGDLGHEWIEHYVRFTLNQGEMPLMPENPIVQQIVDAFLQFEKTHKIKYLSCEKAIYSMKNNFVGRLDIEAMVDGKYALIDIKTANGLYNEVRLQTAAYCKADEKKYKVRYAIRLAKESKEEYLKRMEEDGKENFAPWVVFEEMNLDLDNNDDKYQYRIDEDYEAFLHFKAGHEWNNSTDRYLIAMAKKAKS